MISSNSVTRSLDSFLIFIAIFGGGFLLPFTYRQNADLFIPHFSANFAWIKCLESKYCINFINYPKIVVDTVDVSM